MSQASRIGPVTRSLVRELRANATHAETLLWARLRRKQLAGFKFRRQHPVGKYVLDFYCAAARLAIEVDGQQHGYLEHVIHGDERRRCLQATGIEELRFSNREVIESTDAVMSVILERVHERV